MPAGSTAARPPGRPSSGARERILAAALEVLKRDGYAGLTLAKVAARSGQNKALIPYHFGSKQGLVAAVAREVSEQLTEEVLGGLREPRRPDTLVRGLIDGLWQVLERDEGLTRVYFDLSSQSVVDAEVSAIMQEMRAGFRALLGELVAGLSRPPEPRRRQAIAIYLIAGLEGLALERLDRGDSRELRAARELFAATAPAAIRQHGS